MQNQIPDNILKSPQAEQLLGNTANLASLVNSPDTKMLMELLSRSAGGGLKGAAEAAMKGDTSQLMGLMNELMNSTEGAQAVERIHKVIQK